MYMYLQMYLQIYTYNDWAQFVLQENPQVHCGGACLVFIVLLLWILYACMLIIHSPDDVFMAR